MISVQDKLSSQNILVCLFFFDFSNNAIDTTSNQPIPCFRLEDLETSALPKESPN